MLTVTEVESQIFEWSGYKVQPLMQGIGKEPKTSRGSGACYPRNVWNLWFQGGLWCNLKYMHVLPLPNVFTV